jgi:hypothetical protein
VGLYTRILLTTGTESAMKTIEPPPTMVMLLPSDLSSTQLLRLPLQ